jgi:hypothetical protein
MIKHSKIKVIPLIKAYRPKYPSYTDPNPIDHPDSRPYPFTMKMLHTLSAAGFLGTVMFSCGVQTQEYKGDSMPSVPKDILVNPFPLSATNLPYQPAMFGTGLPSRLSSREVSDVLNEAFTEEGLHIVKDTSIRIGNHMVPVSAYSPDTKIGYIWMDYRNYGDGMANSNNSSQDYSSKKSIKKNLKIQIKRLEKSYYENPEKFLEWQVKNDDYAASIKADLDVNLPLQKAGKQRENFIKNRIQEFVLQSIINQALENKQDNFRNKWERSAVTHLDDKEELYITLTQIGGAAHLYYFEPSDLVQLEKTVERIDKEKSKKSWVKHSDAFIELLKVGNPNAIKKNPEYRALLIDIALSADYTKWKDRHDEILKFIDREQISLKELESIADNCDKEYHVAPISQRDARSIYQVDYWRGAEEIRKLKKQRNLEPDALKVVEIQEKIEKFYEREASKSEEREKEAIREQSLRLQKDMKGYIRWAKSQIGY